MRGKLEAGAGRLGGLLGKWQPFTLATAVGAVALAAAAVTVTLDVLGRYLFNHPIQGSSEAVIWFLLPAIWLLPLAYTQRQRMHVGVTALTSHLGIKTQRGLEIFCFIICTGLLAPLCWFAWKEAYLDWVNKTWIQAPLVLYRYPASFITALALSMFLVQFVADLVNRLRK